MSGDQDDIEVIIQKFRLGQSISERDEMLLRGHMSKIAEERSEKVRRKMKKKPTPIAARRNQEYHNQVPQDLQAL